MRNPLAVAITGNKAIQTSCKEKWVPFFFVSCQDLISWINPEEERFLSAAAAQCLSLSLRRAPVLWLRYVVTSASYPPVNRDPGYNESFSLLCKEGNTWMAKGRVEFHSELHEFPWNFLKRSVMLVLVCSICHSETQSISNFELPGTENICYIRRLRERLNNAFKLKIFLIIFPLLQLNSAVLANSRAIDTERANLYYRV